MSDCARPRRRAVALLLTLFASVVAWPSLLAAQTPDPARVEFTPSADHDRTLEGRPLVDSYSLEFYALGSALRLQTINVGKPAPDPDGLIRYTFTGALAPWQVFGIIYEARVVAVGPGGQSTSSTSNPFNFPAAPSGPTPPVNCTPTLSPASRTVSSSATTGNFSVALAPGCSWSAVSSSNWLVVTAGTGGSGNGSVSYSIAANSSSAERVGAITVGSSTFTVSQAGACTYTLTPTSHGFNPPGGTGTVAVSAPPGCPWTATRAGSWISILSGASGSASGTVRFSVSANGGASTRIGTLTIAGRPITITQSASTAPSAPAGLRVVGR